MNTGADVHAIDALQEWHDALCLFHTEAGESLSAIALEIRRAFDWVDDQAKSWYRESREAEEDVVRAKSELAQRRTPAYSGRIPDTSVQEENLARAKARLDFARDQIEVCRSWSVRLPRMISEEYEGAARRLTNFLEADLSAGIVHLNERIRSLHAYTNIKPVEATPPAREKPS